MGVFDEKCSAFQESKESSEPQMPAAHCSITLLTDKDIGDGLGKLFTVILEEEVADFCGAVKQGSKQSAPAKFAEENAQSE